MPYKNATSVSITRPTKKQLAELKAEGQSWDELLREIAERGLQGGDRQ